MPRESIRHYYALPFEFFTRIISSIGAPCINFLTSLTLMYVDVTSGLLEHCLSNCPVLERLHVAHSKCLVRLKIHGPSLQLKYLHLINCIQIRSIEIFAPNLESFGFVGLWIELSVNYAPCLVDVLIGGIYPVCMSYLFCFLSSYLSQLQCLTLDICNYNNVSTLYAFTISCIYFYSV